MYLSKIRLIYNRSAREAIAMQEVQQVSELANLTLTKRELIEVQRGERTAWILKTIAICLAQHFEC